MYHFIYKTTNLLNGKYYVGRHSTNDINDGYKGSGLHLVSAIKKYGEENFKTEILEFAATSEELWLLEEKYITKDMIEDENCYNMAFGGKNYIASLKRNDFEKFVMHQSNAGKRGGIINYNAMSAEEKREWHKKGRAASPGAKNKTWELSDSTKQKQAISALKRKKYVCEHCNKSFDGGNFKKHSKKIAGITNKLD